MNIKMSIVVGMIMVCLMFKQLVSGRMLDLTYVLKPGSPAYPGNIPFKLTPLRKEMTSGGFWVEFNWFSTSEHKGTHIDAPKHFIKHGLTLEHIPMERLVGPGVVFRAIEEAKNNSDFEISREWLVNWESRYGRIPEKSIVFMHFGWGREDNNMNLLFGSENTEDTSTFHFPGIGGDGMEFLVKERNIFSIGTDATSIDIGQTKTYLAHRMSLGNNVTVLENVAKLDQLPVTGAHIVVAPIKLLGGSGGQARIIAFIDEDPLTSTRCSASTFYVSFYWALFGLFSMAFGFLTFD
ncbi:hypothetical protein LOTGIDRAFT_238594 [Lottia gigantea]|uniref:Cyclase n=1 Tax=Lottia gigantea TaxID=225164 RepID=V4B1U5_LOTGI|nr:hypothetical protein LOTGIDRAFT_238594 [Lottia gigantea]ESP00307.1 hypothetical protein LOTGIDRAFT_238594 [Lottia gigantea]